LKFTLASIGKPNEEYIDAGVKLFTRRIGNYFDCEWKILTPRHNRTVVSEVRFEEAALILQLLEKENPFFILLDEKGKNLSSIELAALIEKKAGDAVKQILFLIGGAYGVDQTIRDRAHLVWSLSNLTFPHQLVRLILAEQIYRACTIMRNEKYHHS
jgi:23S rRNA (pseudouridine1915-N3)-methyltransferase